MMNRRDVLNLAVSAGTASVLLPTAVPSAEHQQSRFAIIDTNITLFQWPFRRLPLDDPDALIRKFRALGITQAWAGSFAGILQRDLTGVNQRLAETCRRHPELIPIGSMNPELTLGYNKGIDDQSLITKLAVDPESGCHGMRNNFVKLVKVS